eukprot:CAMPEP_0183452166 /NCGR_PEP_ID=MMETSP0370-20130417/117144_1 /TAXON_ID=268820 /ORGANISM="Peridinium aciculiferum, Strain PAER-2" /LENGTH=44 /DNA_ID= /DNA_START= /DNA_END= /DNA_ORIENTATION=
MPQKNRHALQHEGALAAGCGKLRQAVPLRIRQQQDQSVSCELVL